MDQLTGEESTEMSNVSTELAFSQQLISDFFDPNVMNADCDYSRVIFFTFVIELR